MNMSPINRKAISIIRNIILLTIMVLGAAMIIIGLSSYETELPNALTLTEFTVLSIAAIAVFRFVQRGRIPFASWHVAPVLVGMAVTILAQGVLKGFLSDLGGSIAGFGAGLFSYSVLQFWADSKGHASWFGIVALAVFLSLTLTMRFVYNA